MRQTLTLAAIGGLRFMDLHLLVMDNFLEEVDELRAWAIQKGFKEEISPADGLAYKGVCKDPPWFIMRAIESKLSFILNTAIVNPLHFIRLSLSDLSKRWIHADPMYSQWVLVIYMNPIFPKGAGTRLFSHPELNLFEPDGLTEYRIALWDQICNSPDEWEVIGEIPMKHNRAAIYNTKIFHASLPREGFGKDPETGRMAYVMFFNVLG
jgi:hypothetical protein